MNKVFKNVLGAMGFSSEEENEEFEEEYEAPKPRVERTQRSTSYSSSSSSTVSQPQKKGSRVLSMSATTQLKVVVIKPSSFDEAKEIADHLKERKPVVVNLELLEKDVALKIFDFLSGAVYVLDGCVQRISNNIYLIAPYNVTIIGDFQNELKSSSLWMSE